MTRPCRVIVYWSREVGDIEEDYEVECSLRIGTTQPTRPNTGWVPGDGDSEVEIITVRDASGQRPDIAELLQDHYSQEIKEAALDTFWEEADRL